jgi:Gpi18-like mannosyltransferase
MIASIWKVFTKAGKPGWAALVPIYNLVVMLEIAGKPLWWFILFLIPVVNLVAAFITYISLAERFGKGAGFGIGLILLGPIFFPILGFGSAQYQGSQTAYARAA